MAPTKELLAARLRGLRAERRLSQAQVAEAVGVDENTISAYENERAWPSYETAWKLADLFCVTMEGLCPVEKRGVA